MPKKVNIQDIKAEDVVGKIMVLQSVSKVVIKVETFEKTEKGPKVTGSEIGGDNDGRHSKYFLNPADTDVNVYEERELTLAMLD